MVKPHTIWLIIIILINFGLRLWAIDRSSLWDIQPDESPRVIRSVQIVATGELNHGYFNHPSSTVIYPLAAMYYIWGIIAYNGPLFGANPFLNTAFRLNPGEFYLLGRYFTLAFTTISIPLIYLLGQRLFNKTTGVIATSFWIILPGIAHYSQVVRDDLTGSFFTLLSLWFCLRLLDRPSIWGQVWAGSVIGLAIATRYLMVPLVSILLLVDALLWLQAGQQSSPRKQLLLPMIVGLLSIPLAFALSTPYFFLDLEEVQKDLLYESRTEHPGSDGLTPLGNFIWYLTEAIPASMTWPLTLLALVGGAITLLKPTTKQILAVGFGIIFIGAVSIHPLHWARWIIPTLPIIGLLAARGLSFLISYLSGGLSLRPFQHYLVLIFAVVILCIEPITDLNQQLNYQLIPTTQALARKWLLQNVPADSGIILETGTALVEDNLFRVYSISTLPKTGYTIDQAYLWDYRYIVVNLDLYQQYKKNRTNQSQNEPDLYQTLFDKGVLLQEIKPSRTRIGPMIRIYELPGQ